jgi:putative transposase
LVRTIQTLTTKEEKAVANYSMTPEEWMRKGFEEHGSDLLREMLAVFTQIMMSADADAVCGAEYGSRSPERVNRRNGYRSRSWDTRVGTLELQIPKLREGTYFPDFLLEPRRRAERALVSVVKEHHL